MPLKGAKYRWVRRGGKLVRLAWVKGKVVEVKRQGGKAHRVR